MMGQLPPAQNSLFYDFSLEQHIPEDHLLRQIDRFLDFDRIREYLQPFYSRTGRPSIDPELMLRMLLLGYCYGIRSERRLCEEVHFNLAYRWFCRLGLEQTVPDHSTFSKNRHGRYRDSDLFRFVFETIVQRCMEEGLVKGEGFAIDGSLIQADVSRQRASSKGQVIDWGPAEQQSRPVRDYLAALDEESTRNQPASISFTDPAARWTAARGKAQFAYSTNYLLDVHCGVIVDVEASPGNRIDEVATTAALLDRVEATYEITPQRLMGDSAYGSAPMLDYLITEKGIEPHVPVWDKSQRNDGTFSRSDFHWDPANDQYICPAGKVLRPRQRAHRGEASTANKDQMIRYRSRKRDCEQCELKPRCCPNTPQRKIPRSVYETSREKVRLINQSVQFRHQSSRERKKVEMAFAHMKQQLNFRRLRLRGLTGANDECILVAAAQNLRKLARLCSQPPPDHRASAPA